MREHFIEEVFKLKEKFSEKLCLDIFHYQAQFNPVYKEFISLLKINLDSVTSINKIPFLPIELFKTKKIITGNKPAAKVFESSGSTAKHTSKHYVADLGLYEKSFMSCFKKFYGEPHDYCILALLPSYVERENSSLVHMVNALIKESENHLSGFYLNETNELFETLNILEAQKTNTFLIGVSFALLDLAEKIKMNLQNTIVMETGGMKGRREEIVRTELHEILKKAFGVKNIHSEYGMTELLSQAYSIGDGFFETPPWMDILISDINDPFTFIDDGNTGIINIIDLANIDSCCFIRSSDLGKKYEDGKFEVIGRAENSDLRGCNLLIS